MQDDAPAQAWLEADNGMRWLVEQDCTIGRSPSNRLVLEDRKVSRRHAVLHRQDVSEYWLVDLGSGNGTYLNGVRVALPSQVRDGDTIGLGDWALTFRQLQSAPPQVLTQEMISRTVIEVRNTKCWMLLADIVGSTRLSIQHDPVAWALLVGSWAGECRRIVELHGGDINKYLGDGFLAIWEAKPEPVEHVGGAMSALVALQESSNLPFRLVLHYGEVLTGGQASLSENSLSGLELIFLFRMERLASQLGTRFLCSQAAYLQLAERDDLVSIGEHPVAGYVDDRPYRFFGLKADSTETVP